MAKVRYEEYPSSGGKKAAKKAKKMLGSVRKGAIKMMSEQGQPQKAKKSLKALKSRLKKEGKKATGL